MNTVFKGVRPGDVVLALALTALGVLLMVGNINAGPDDATRVDSHSWAMVPVFAAATLPILWRRRSMVFAYGIAALALAVHVLAFGYLVRCGAGLPLAFALAYGVGRLDRGRAGVLGLLATIAVQALVLVQDSAAGLGIIPVTAVIGVAFWGVGSWLRHRSEAESMAPATPAGSYV